MSGRARTLAAAGALVLLSACSGSGTNGATGGYVGADGSITEVAVADREDAPVLSGEDLEGDPITSEDFAGQVLVVNVWGSWCAPCRREAPVLKEVSEEYADRGVQFLGINVRDNPSAAKAFDRTFGITYPSIDDYDRRTVLGFTDSLPAQAIPTTWIIDAEGKVAARLVVDNLTTATLSGLIDDVQESTS